MIKCVNGHTIDNPAYAFCPFCGSKIQKPAKAAVKPAPKKSEEPAVRPADLVDHSVNFTELLYNVNDGVKLFSVSNCCNVIFKKPDSKPEELEKLITSKYAEFIPYKTSWLVSPHDNVQGCMLNDIEMQHGKYYILHCNDILSFPEPLSFIFMPTPGNEEVMNAELVIGLKRAIEAFSSGVDDRNSIKDIVLQLIHCPMYFAVVDKSVKVENSDDDLKFLSLRTDGQSSIPMFTTPAEGKKFAACRLVRLAPDQYIDKLINVGLPVCIDPFSNSSIMLSYDGIVRAVKPQLQKEKTSFKNGDMILGKKSRYTITEVPDDSGFYRIYKACDEKHKTYRLCCYDKTASPFTKEQTDIIFERAKRMHRFNDPCVIRAKEIVEDENKLCLFCPEPEGVTLESILEQTKLLPEPAVVNYAIMIAEALQYLHTFTPQFIACDLKPSGIYITPENKVVLADFDISDLIKPRDAVSIALKRSYAAPELYFDISMAGEYSDSYSIGILMYHLLTGLDVTLSWQPLPPIRGYNARFSKKLDMIVTKCLADNPGERYQGCKELINDLYRCKKK